MPFKERIYSVLVVSNSTAFDNSIGGLLSPTKYESIKYCNNISESKRIIAERDYDFIIINSPLPDDAGIRFAIDSCRKNSVVLLLVKNDIYADVTDKVSAHGVFTLSKPTSSSTVLQALNFMISMRERLRKSEQKNATVEERIEEIRLINRAKCLLISELNMTEADAHRYIEKTSMNNCVSKRETAKNIIKTYT